MTVADNVSFRLREEAMDETEIDEQVREALRFVEMEDALEKFPADFRAECAGAFRLRRAGGSAAGGALRFADGGAGSGDFADDHYFDFARARFAGVTALLATHRVQDAFGLANFRFDQERAG